MNVCHFVASQGIGRGEFYVDLVNELSRHIEVSLVIPRGAKFLHRINPDVKVVEYRSGNTRNNPFLIFELYKIFKSLSPSIVHTHFDKATEIFYFINRVLKLHHVATKHNPRKGRIFSKVQHVTAVSNCVRQSIDKENVRIIHNGILPDFTDMDDVKNGRFTILAVGRLEKIKGFDLLISACAKLEFDYQLIIIGEGPERGGLEKLVNDLGVENRVNLMGFSSRVPQMMHRSDLVVVSSHSEGFSLVILEAMQYGKMLLSTPVGVAAEILSDTFIIHGHEFSEKINSVHADYAQYCQSFAKLKTEYNKMFDLKNIALEYVSYYKNIVD